MSRARALFVNEALKTTRRLAFRVAIVCFVIIAGIGALGMHRVETRLRRPFALPDGLSDMIGGLGDLTALIAAVLVILLVASEFGWKTARQNVIDGLSKDEFFAGKLGLVVAVALLLPAIVVISSVPIALLGPASTVDGVLIDRDVGADLARLVLGLIGIGCAALLLAVVIRGSGAALAVYFAYVVILERLAGLAIRRSEPAWWRLAELLPSATFSKLFSPGLWTADGVQPGALSQALAAGQEGGAAPLPAVLVLAVAAGYTALFAAAAYQVFHARDL